MELAVSSQLCSTLLGWCFTRCVHPPAATDRAQDTGAALTPPAKAPRGSGPALQDLTQLSC